MTITEMFVFSIRNALQGGECVQVSIRGGGKTLYEVISVSDQIVYVRIPNTAEAIAVDAIRTVEFPNR